MRYRFTFNDGTTEELEMDSPSTAAAINQHIGSDVSNLAKCEEVPPEPKPEPTS